MYTFVIVMTLGQVPAGPLDRFKANFASIKADVDYRFEFGQADANIVTEGKIWKREPIDFPLLSRRTVEGRWEYDGKIERYEGRAPAEVLNEERARRKPGINPYYTESFEMIFDGETFARHFLPDSSQRSWRMMAGISIHPPGLITSGGPFVLLNERFPLELDRFLAHARVERMKTLRDGHPVEVEIYFDTRRGNEIYEVDYDPTIGFAPRYMRWCGEFSGDKQSKAAVREMYLLNAEPCKAGGFIPTEWYHLSYTVAGSEYRSQPYSIEKVYRPDFPKIGLGHYRASRIRDREGPVGFAHLEEGIKTIGSIGGYVTLNPPRQSLTLDEVKTLLGPKLRTKESNKGLPNLDRDELRENPQSNTDSGFRLAPLLSVLLVAPVALLIWRRWGKRSLLVALLLILGCKPAHQSSPVLKVSASFAQPTVLTDRATKEAQAILVVKNEGSTPLLFQGANGGCTCREIDQSPFPQRVGPGKTLSLKVTFQDRKIYIIQNVIISFKTDRGVLNADAAITVLPRNHVSPDSLTHYSLYENDDWAFEVVHRQLYEGDRPPPTRVVAEPAFAVKELSRRTGRVAALPGMNYQDTKYRFTLLDRQLGQFLSRIAIRGEDDRILTESTVVWRRLPFLSLAPERVVLGNRPVRVFLRCPDEHVELTRVLAAPPPK